MMTIKKLVPHLSIFFICLITINLWLLSKNDFSVLIQQPLRSLSQILALLGIVLMSLTLVLSTRIRATENSFGGLDRVYLVHRILGSLAFIYLINHPLLLTTQSFLNADLYLLPGNDLSYNLGIFSIYFMILAFIFTVLIKLPYHLWKFTHKILGLSFLLGSLHTLFVASDVSLFLPLRLWIGFFISLGLTSALYSIFLYRYFGPKHLYGVEKIERSLDIINIYLKPLTQKLLRFNPGQFTYVKFTNPQIGSESHPFSLSSAPYETLVRLSVKISGDYTLKLPNLRPNDQALIYGPYGKFETGNSIKRVLWIAGGIGVSPFLSMLRAEAHQPKLESITFFGCCRAEEEAVFCEEIKNLAKNIPHLNFVNWCSTKNQRLSVNILGQMLDLHSLDAILLCGPAPMIESLSKQFLEIGIPKEKIIFENFSFV